MYIVGEGMVEVDEFIDQLLIAIPEYKIIRTNKREEYYNIPAAFDIEVSSFYQNGIIDPDNKRIYYYTPFQKVELRYYYLLKLGIIVPQSLLYYDHRKT